MKRFYIITLALLLPICHAQGQSLKLHLVGDAIPYSFKWDCSHNGGPYFDSTQLTGTIPVRCDLNVVPTIRELFISFSVASNDTTISFTIDLAFHLLRQFNLFCATQTEGPHGPNTRFGIAIDSVPYTGDTGTIIVAPGSYRAQYGDGISLSTSENGYTCDGGTSNQGNTWVTTFELQRSIAAAANVAGDLQPPTAFRVIPTPEGLAAKYTSSDFTRTIEIVNSIGASSLNLNIPAGSEEIQLPPLPHGCYFARIGNQTTKFCVLP